MSTKPKELKLSPNLQNASLNRNHEAFEISDTPPSIAENRKSKIEPINVWVGGRLRTARIAKVLSQSEVATVLKVSYQQYQRYESGFKRVPPKALCELSTMFDVGIEWFFKDEKHDLKVVIKSASTQFQRVSIKRLLTAVEKIEDESDIETLLLLAEHLVRSSEYQPEIAPD